MRGVWEKDEHFNVVFLAPLKELKRNMADMTVNEIKKRMISGMFNVSLVELFHQVIRDVIKERVLRLVAFC
jgi:hypothetical protein